MSRLSPKKLVTPQSILIEQTALQLAAAYYEQGRSLGLASKFKTPQAYARKYVTNFIPLAVSTLMDMLASNVTRPEMKEMIYEAFMERANDEDLSTNGIKQFELPVEYKTDKFTPPKPLVFTTKDRIENLPLETMLSSTKRIIANG